MKLKHFIDSHKGVTAIVILIMIHYYNQQDNETAWIYLALHGTYGILWVLKSNIFGDKQWEQPTNFLFGLLIFGVLNLYWIAPWLITSRNIHAPAWLLGASVSTYGFGLFFHFTSDIQKYTALKLKPGLITTGMFSRCRNINYFGELLIYIGFCMLSMHWIPFAVLGFFIVTVWIPNMIKKDSSLSRYPQFTTYKAKSSLLFPYKFWQK